MAEPIECDKVDVWRYEVSGGGWAWHCLHGEGARYETARAALLAAASEHESTEPIARRFPSTPESQKLVREAMEDALTRVRTPEVRAEVQAAIDKLAVGAPAGDDSAGAGNPPLRADWLAKMRQEWAVPGLNFCHLCSDVDHHWARHLIDHIDWQAAEIERLRAAVRGLTDVLAGGGDRVTTDALEPECTHEPAGRVTAGSLNGAHASTYVCGRAECIQAAVAWAEATSGKPAVFVPSPVR